MSFYYSVCIIIMQKYRLMGNDEITSHCTWKYNNIPALAYHSL